MRAALSSSRLHLTHPLKGRSIEVRAGNRTCFPAGMASRSAP